MASTCRTWKIIWIEFISDLPEKWLHNRFLAGEYLTLMTLLVILPLILKLSPLLLSLPMVSKTAHFLPFSAYICMDIRLLHLLPDDWEFPRQSQLTFLKSLGCFLEVKCVKRKLLNPKYSHVLLHVGLGWTLFLQPWGQGGVRGAVAGMLSLSWSEPWQPSPTRGDTLRDISCCVCI